MRGGSQIAVLALLAMVALQGRAGADGISGYVEEDVSRSRSTTRDQAGNSQRFDTDAFTQRYRLTLDRALFPTFRFSGGGTFEQVLAATDTDAGPTDSSSRISTLFANLLYRGPAISGAAGYVRRMDTSGASGTAASTLVNEEPSLILNWKPALLPSVALRLSRPHLYDTDNQIEDTTTNQALFTMSYAPVRQIDVQYSASYLRPIDHLHQTDSTSIAQTARANYADTFAGDTRSVAAGLTVSDRESEITSSGVGGTLATQQFPIAGESLVETPLQTSELDTLVQNAGVIDGNTTAPAGLDLGFSIALAGDTNPRDIGVQFTDVLTKVNTLYVWVDKQLPANVSGAFAWTVWQSDDNLRWTQIPLAGPVLFAAFQNRFELTIPTVAARYLKVVTRPLDPATTTDRRFADLQITELQTILITPVTGAQSWQSARRASFNTSLRTQLFNPSFSYDLTLILTRSTQTGAGAVDTYLAINGLNFSRKLNPVFLVSARVARQDQDQSRGHEGLFLYSASLAANPLPTLSHALVYSGQAISASTGFATTNSLSLFNRAIPYRGISLIAGFIYSLNTAAAAQTNQSDTVTIGAQLQPNPRFTLGGNFGHTDTRLSGGALAPARSFTNRVDGNLTFTPVPALFISGGATRTVSNERAATLANGALTYSPFTGGDLQLSLNYSQTLDSANAVTRLITPTARWNIRPGAFLTLSYTLLDSDANVASTHSRVLNANLTITL